MHVDRLAGAHCALGARTSTQRYWLALCMALLIMSWTFTAAAAVCYVNGAASGVNNGAAWTDAYTDLQSALTDTNCTEVWVAQGVYKPTPTTTQTLSFYIGPNVAVYGGFAGGETSRVESDPVAHVTILSGDLDNNDDSNNADGNFIDETSAEIVGSNSRHIVALIGNAGTPITATTVLDGFTLTGGDNSNNTEGGGALWCRGNGAGHACSPTLARLVVSGNRAVNGGAMAFDGYSAGVSNPALTNVTFSGNHATLFGGAMYNNAQLAGATSSPTLTNVTFSGNSSGNYGGAMVNDGTAGGNSSPTMTNVTFSGNSAINGGAMFNNGGAGTSSPKLVNATFNGNSASYGGAIYNSNAFGPLLLNSILWGDSATTSGDEFFSNNGETSLYYSIVQGGCSVSCGGAPIYTGDPLLGVLADNGGFVQTLMPGASSPAIDAVPCNYATEEPIFDARGAVRPDSASSGPTRCDIGAVEANSLPGDLIFADKFGSSTWDDF
jgi:hypothetical protein